MKELRHTPGPSHSTGFLRQFSANPNNETRAISTSGENSKAPKTASKPSSEDKDPKTKNSIDC